jgi:hypothetical protein
MEAGMGWQTEEFGRSHEGLASVLLEDGTEPKLAYVPRDPQPGVTISEWWAYDGKYHSPRAAYVRGSCSCGWRGSSRYAVEWDDDGPYVDEAGPRGDWDRHIADVESGTVPLPEDFKDLLVRLERRLSALESDSPLAALRAVSAVERAIRRIGWDAALDIDPGQLPWEEMGKALGWSSDEVRSRLWSYHPDGLRPRYWTQSEKLP